jgi:hypothetical protein
MLTPDQKNINILNRFEGSKSYESVSKIRVMIGSKPATIISTQPKTDDELIASCRNRWPNETITKIS